MTSRHQAQLPVQWPESVWEVPQMIPADDYDRPGVQAFYFVNEPYHGRETRVFGFLGLPYLAEGTQCPGMVLIHGGGGTAFDEWVRLWNQRGYAAIAIDLCGNRPDKECSRHVPPHLRDAYSGPEGWNASFQQMDEPVTEHWQYHAVAALIRAHTILASLPEVDAGRIGVTGISWGGYMTSLIMGIDQRYLTAVPVYGCGFLTQNSCWRDDGLLNAEDSRAKRWIELWEPSHYLPSARIPSLWVSGTNDFAYPLDALQLSYRAVSGPVSLAIEVERPHSHVDGWSPQEIHVFMDALAFKRAPLPFIHRQVLEGDRLMLEFDSVRPIMRAKLVYTRASGQWQDRKYNSQELKVEANRVEAQLPRNTTVAFINLYDDRGCCVSSPHIERSQT
ncbi:MAG: hypothetical protein D6820_05585 [Lentisphaerae bacterium]|nr:MAG: hypothetical protein D6820_05585 [Lentisphaerota bacterium]